MRGDDLYLEEPLQLPTSMKDDSSLREELDRVPTLQSFSPAEDGRRRHRFFSTSPYSPLYRCYSTSIDPPTYSRLGSQAPRRRRISWCSFDDKLIVHPAVERCRQQDSRPPGAESTDTASTTGDATQPNHEVNEPAPAVQNEAQANMASVYLREQLRAMFQVADNRLAMKLFGSHNAVMKEKQRQKAVGTFVIHPCSSFRY